MAGSGVGVTPHCPEGRHVQEASMVLHSESMAHVTRHVFSRALQLPDAMSSGGTHVDCAFAWEHVASDVQAVVH